MPGMSHVRHTVPKCHLLPKVLAVMDFARQNKNKCDLILKHHRSNKPIEAKKNVVRVLQNMNLLPFEVDSDDFMENECIINTMMDNIFDPDGWVESTQK